MNDWMKKTDEFLDIFNWFFFIEFLCILFLQGPVVTDNGNFILDWQFPNEIRDWDKINREISLIPGVVEVGLFVKMAKKVYFGLADGNIKEQS